MAAGALRPRRLAPWLLLAVAIAAAPPIAAVELRWQPLGDEPGRGEVRVAGLPPAAVAAVAEVPEAAAAWVRVVAVAAGAAGSAVKGPGTQPLPPADRSAGGPDAAAAAVSAPTATSPAGSAATAAESLPALWGRWRRDGDELVFTPRHVLGAGTTLVARLDGAALAAATGAPVVPDVELRHQVASGAPVARVVAVAPGGEELPANLLRFYVEFSHPMSLAGIDRHVRLLGADGTAIESAFATPADGLWDPERRRLTLIVHPGRVKSGLGLGDDLGPVLVPGATVTLEVGSGARDADGRTLVAGFRRSWRVGPARRDAIDPSEWELLPPAGSREPLTIRAAWPLDRAVAPGALRVVEGGGDAVAGSWVLAEGERELRFHPATAWRIVPHRLEVAAHLEDPSGNRPGRPFERAAGAGAESSGAAASTAGSGATQFPEEAGVRPAAGAAVAGSPPAPAAAAVAAPGVVAVLPFVPGPSEASR